MKDGGRHQLFVIFYCKSTLLGLWMVGKGFRMPAPSIKPTLVLDIAKSRLKEKEKTPCEAGSTSQSPTLPLSHGKIVAINCDCKACMSVIIFLQPIDAPNSKPRVAFSVD